MNPTTRASLEFAIADKNTSLTAPLERGVIVTGKFTPALPDPSQLTLYFRPLTWAIVNRLPKIDTEGRFQFSGLSPGEYRAIAVRPELRQDLERPYVLEQLLRAGPKITIAPSQSQSIELKPASIPGLQ